MLKVRIPFTTTILLSVLLSACTITAPSGDQFHITEENQIVDSCYRGVWLACWNNQADQFARKGWNINSEPVLKQIIGQCVSYARQAIAANACADDSFPWPGVSSFEVQATDIPSY